MLHRIRLELSVLATLAVAIAALVLAIRAGGPEAVSVAQEATNSEPEVAVDFVPKGAVEVDIVDFAYNPEPVRVQAGTPIAWTNFDAAPHTATADDGAWGSQVLGKGETWVTTFDEPGVYVYICKLHPPRQATFYGAPEGTALVGGGGGIGMQGTIIVE